MDVPFKEMVYRGQMTKLRAYPLVSKRCVVNSISCTDLLYRLESSLTFLFFSCVTFKMSFRMLLWQRIRKDARDGLSIVLALDEMYMKDFFFWRSGIFS